MSPWLSSTAINNVRNRRKAKAVGDSKSYKKLNAEFQKQARRDKEAYLNYLCNIIQKYNLNSKILYKAIKKITRKRNQTMCSKEQERENYHRRKVHQ